MLLYESLLKQELISIWENGEQIPTTRKDRGAEICMCTCRECSRYPVKVDGWIAATAEVI